MLERVCVNKSHDVKLAAVERAASEIVRGPRRHATRARGRLFTSVQRRSEFCDVHKALLFGIVDACAAFLSHVVLTSCSGMCVNVNTTPGKHLSVGVKEILERRDRNTNTFCVKEASGKEKNVG